ncbi:MAG: PVC-type heme-binding CxxCH protein [Planctomycetota bacterium]|jgi:putative heme-binding domain-containing protein
MKRLTLLAIVLYPPVLWSSAVAGAAPPIPEHIQVPEGFVIERVAAAPLTTHPMMAAFDDQGRLYVAEAAGVNMNADDLAKNLPNLVRRLEDTDGDGVFDRSTVFADKMTFPQGAAWRDGALYVASPPSVWRLEDTDDDGVADVRTEIATGFNYTGNAASVHGPFAHPDGRLYWCHGRKSHEVYQHDGTLVSKNLGARVWSSNPDGSDIQVFAGGGMDNPTELAFTATGDVLGTVPLFYGRPRGDGLVHWVYGGAYPRHDMPDAIVGLKTTGELLPPVLNLGHVAPSGVMRYRDNGPGGFGKDYLDNLFLVEFNTHRLLRIEMSPEGATFAATPSPFVTSDHTDTHFTDVLQDADGSLLLIDTGGWFRQGCPTSRIAKPDVHGAIYRIRRADAPRPRDPRGLALNWDNPRIIELFERLDDPRFAVRDRAIEAMADLGAKTIWALARALDHQSSRLRRNALWALMRIGTPRAKQQIRRELTDRDPTVRQVAAHGAFITRDEEAQHRLIGLLEEDPSPAVRRVAAQALGRINYGRVAWALYKSLAEPQNHSDRMLEHAILYALIEINRLTTTLKALEIDRPEAVRAALMVLDRNGRHDALAPRRLFTLARHEHPGLARTALDIVKRRQEWALPIRNELSRVITQTDWDDTDKALIEALLVDRLRDEAATHDYASNAALPGSASATTGQALNSPNLSEANLMWLLELLTREAAPYYPTWGTALAQALKSPNEELVRLAIKAFALRDKPVPNPIGRIAADPERDPLTRLVALRATARDHALADEAFAFIMGLWNKDGAVGDRLEAARLLAAAKLSEPQLAATIELFRGAGPMEALALSPIVLKSRDPAVGFAALEALDASPGLYSLSANEFRRLFQRYPQPVVDAADATFRRLMNRTFQKENRLAELEALVTTGDAQRGKIAYESGQGACNVCHEVKGAGGKVGPSLSNIGAIRSRRDLLEAIAYPSDSFARDYESYLITTSAGAHLGTILRETPDAVHLMNAAGEETVIQRRQIVSQAPSPVSLMPPGLDLALPPQTLADLVAYLMSLK